MVTKTLFIRDTGSDGKNNANAAHKAIKLFFPKTKYGYPTIKLNKVWLGGIHKGMIEYKVSAKPIIK